MRVFVRCLVVFLLLGCASSGALVHLSEHAAAPDLSAEELRRGGVAVLGFEANVGFVDSFRRLHFDALLDRELRGEHPTLPVAGPSATRAGLAASGVEGRAHAALATGKLQDFPFAELEPRFRTRFMLAAELLSNTVIRTDSRSDDSINYCTTRAMAVRYRLLDLRAHTTAWRGVVSAQRERCNENARNNKAGQAKSVGGFFAGLLADAIVDSTTDAVWGTYPKPCSEREVIEANGRDFARVLEGAKHPAEGRP